MILKKPYAFLIKYYRIIHLALAFLLGVGVYKLSSIITFFNNYVKNGYTTTVVTDLDKLYTPLSVYMMVLLILLLAGAILVLLIHKKKPAKVYMGIIAYYLFIFFGLFYISSILRSFEMELLASTVARSLRDILIIVYIPQFIFIGLILLRTIGFNVKKFDFSDERKEFGESEQDSEEFEIKIKFEGYKVKQKTNRALREGVYYVKENKLIVLCIVIVLSIVGLYKLFDVASRNYDVNYRVGTLFKYNNLNITIEDAMVSNLDYKGEVISDNYYLVLKIHLVNESGNTISMDYNNFKLLIGNKIYNPTVNLARHFVDYASSSLPNSVSHKMDRTVALVYELSEKESRKSMKLRIHNGSVYEDGEYKDKHIFIDLDPERVPDVAIANNYKVGQTISFDDTYINNTKLTIKEYIVTKKYVYRYEICKDNGDCQQFNDAITVPVTDNRHDNRLVILGVEYSQDKETGYSDNYTSLYGFANNFVKIQYKVGDVVYSSNSLNVTPATSTTLMAFEVPKNIEEASIIQAIITVRNKKYMVNLKVGD